MRAAGFAWNKTGIHRICLYRRLKKGTKVEGLYSEIHKDTGETKKDPESEPPWRLRVGITYNLKKNIPSELPDAEAEFDDMDTIRAIQGALETAGFDAALYEATEELPVRLLQDRPDIVFNIAEGMAGRGREAQVPAILNFMGIPFTGSDETTMCVAMDKALTKRLVASCGVNTPKYQVVRRGSSVPAELGTGLSWPVIIKPNTEGSSKGISDLSIVGDSAALRRVLAEKINAYREDMLLEEFISGREFSVGILGNGNNLRIFPPMEIIFTDKTHRIYSYDVKRNFRQYVRYECPANIGANLRKEIEDTAETVYRVLECRDFARIDFRLSGGEPADLRSVPCRDPAEGIPAGQLFFIEINPLPGLAPGYSDFPLIAGFCGMDYTALIRNILDSALTRYGLPQVVR